MSKKWLNNNNMLTSEMSGSTSTSTTPTPTKLSNMNNYQQHQGEYVIDYFVDGSEKNGGGNGSVAIGGNQMDQGATTSASTMADFPIGTFSMDDEYGRMLTLLPTGKEIHSSAAAAAAALSNKNMATEQTTNGGSGGSGGGARETGIIEKLLHSYGFIQCCERQARLFFHFSQFSGNLEHLKIGDPVEFEMTYDRRTGKPIASFVSKISPEAVAREERVTGSVTIEPECGPNNELLQMGRISYENRGECFFLPFGRDDVEGTNVRLTIGDKVSFQIATNSKGNLGAQNIRLENAINPIKYRGIINSIKDHFGFIERADVVKEIFFHFSEIQMQQPDTIVTASVGDHVEFTIQTRNGKEIACNIEKLPNGSVILEDISEEIMKGQVLKPIDRREVLLMLQQQQQQQNGFLTASVAAGVSSGSQPQTVPMMYESGTSASSQQPIQQPQGRIRYRALVDHAETEITFGYRDQVGDFTLKHGDWVRFRICNDRRDQLKRAKMIELMPECSFNVSGEKRECGIVDKLCDCYGFLRCVDREARVFFHFSELLEPHFGEPKLNDEFEFTAVNTDLVMQSLSGSGAGSGASQSSSSNSKQKFNAIRLRKLEFGTVRFEIVLRTNLRGIIAKDIFHNTLLSDDNLLDNGASGDSNGGDSTIATTQMLGNHTFATIDHIYSGLISYTNENGSRSMITFYLKDCDSRNALPQVGDTVDFNLSQVKATKEIIATSVQIVSTAAAVEQVANALAMSPPPIPQEQPQPQPAPPANNFAQQPLLIGFVTQTFKENFGFIETFDQRDEIFFHYSHFDGDIAKLKAGEPVQYILSANNDRGFTASYVRFLNDDADALPHVVNSDRKFKGVVIRALRHFNSDQNEYSGLVEIVDLLPSPAAAAQDNTTNGAEESNGPATTTTTTTTTTKPIGLVYHYGLMSLSNKSDIIQVGDCVQFHLDSENRVANLCLLRKWLKSTVDAIKGDFGFLTHEIQDGRKLFFHMSEVAGTDNGNSTPSLSSSPPNSSTNNVDLKVGDTVKFFIVKNHRTGKCSAHNIIKIEKKHERPERLINRLRQISIGNDNGAGPKVSIIRQPRGPDNTKGFAPNARLRHLL